MKAELKESGSLVIITESKIEEMAIRTWIRDNISINDLNDDQYILLPGSLMIPSGDGFDFIDYELEKDENK